MAVSIKGYSCPPFQFHITHDGNIPLTFRIEDLNNPSNFVQIPSTLGQNGRYNVSAWDFGYTLSLSPCLRFGSNICYKITCISGSQNAQYLVIKFNGISPNGTTFEYDENSETFALSSTQPGNTQAFSYSIASASQSTPPCSRCHEIAYITENYLENDGINYYPQPSPIPANFTMPLIESDGVIIFDATIISSTGFVRADANPANNGSIHLDTGFETMPGAVFIAQALDGCGPLIPN